MTKHKWRESVKSFLGGHIDPENDEQLKGTKMEMERKVQKMLKLIKNEDLEENGGNLEGNAQKESLAELIGDFQKHYESLYEQYDNLTGKLRKKVHGKQKNESSSSSSSDSDSDHNSKDKRSRNGGVGSEFQRAIDGMKQELEFANFEVDELKRKLTEISEEKEALNLNYGLALTKIHEAEKVVETLKLDAEKLSVEKSNVLVENEELVRKLETSGKIEAEINKRLEDMNMEKEAALQRIEEGQNLKNDVDKLKGDNVILEQELGTLREEASNLRKQLESSEQQVSDLSQNHRALEEENKSLSLKVSDTLNEITQGQKVIQDLMAGATDLEEKLGAKERELLTLLEMQEVRENESSAHIRELGAHVESKEAEARQFAEANKELLDHISQLEIKTEDQRDELSTLAGKLENDEKEFWSRIEKSTAEVKNLQAHIDSLCAEKAELEERLARKVDEASTQVASLTNQVNELQHDLGFLNREKAELVVQLEGKSRENAEYMNQIETLKKDLVNVLEEQKSFADQVNGLQLKVESLNSQKNELEDQITGKTEENELLRQEKLGLLDKINELEKTSTNIGLELAALQEIHVQRGNEASAQLTASTEEVNNLQHELDALRVQKNELESHFEREKREFSDILRQVENKKNELDEQIRAKAEENEQLRQQIVGLQGKVTELEKTTTDREIEFGALKEEMDASQTLRNDRETQLQREKQESSEIIARIEKKKSELEEQVQAKTEENEQLSREILGLQDTVLELEKTGTNRKLEFVALQEMHLHRDNEASAQIVALTEQLNDLQKHFGVQQTQKNELEMQLQREKQESSEIIARMESKKSELEHQIQVKTEENGLVSQEMLVLQDRITESEKTTTDRELEFDALQRMHVHRDNEASTQLTALTEQLNDLQKHFGVQQTQKNELEMQLQREKQESSEIIARMESKKSELEHQIQVKTEENGLISQEMLVLQDRITESEKTTTDRELEFDALQRMHVHRDNEASTQLTALTDQLNNLLHELDILQTQKNELETQLQREKQEFSEILARVENQKSELMSQISDMQAMLKEQETVYNKLTEDYKQLENLFQENQLNLEVAARETGELSQKFHLDAESKDQLVADLQKMIEELKNDIEVKQNVQTELMNQIVDYQKMLKEQEEAFNKLTDEYNRAETSFQECKSKLEVSEIEMAELATEHNNTINSNAHAVFELEEFIEELRRDVEVKGEELIASVETIRNIEVKLRLSNQKLRVTEQLLTEKEDSFRKAEEKFFEEQRKFEERIAVLTKILSSTHEAYRNMISDISLEVNSTFTALEIVIRKFEEQHQHYKDSIVKTTYELNIATSWCKAKTQEKDQLTSKVNYLNKNLQEQKEKEYLLGEKLKKMEGMVIKEENEKLNLTKTVNQLEKKVEALERTMNERDKGIVGLGEEKREAIRQLCVWIEYHRDRYDHLKDVMSKMVVRGQRTTA